MPEAMDAASGGSSARLARIAAEAPGTLLEDALNFPGVALAEALEITDLGDAFRAPLRSAVPTLLLSGDRDGRTYIESHRQLAAGLRGSIHVVVEGAGHDLFMDAPEVTARIVAFLAGQAVSPAPIRSTVNPPAP
jgi:pimeloyl-ACP methyl ester carboxylesterase